MEKRTFAVIIVFSGVLLSTLLFSRKANASTQTPETKINDFKPIDLGLNSGYFNPNNAEGSTMINNPLNIRYNPNNKWLGQIGKNKNGFVIFDNAQNCYRAGAKILASYKKRGIDTIKEIITTWAPPSDNNPTSGYINFVCKELNMLPDDLIQPEKYAEFLIALTRFEIGSFPYTVAMVKSGVKAA